MKQYGNEHVIKLLKYSLFLVVGYTVLSFILPGINDTIMYRYHGSIRSLNDFRAYGVYLQPNMTATLILMLLLCLYYFKSVDSLILLIAGIGIGVTLSRSALIVLFLFILLSLNRKYIFRYVFVILVFSFLSILYTTYDERVYERIQTIIALSNGVEEVGSLDDRFNAFESYISLIVSSPFIGIGAIEESKYVDSKLLPHSSHNTHLALLVRYGLFYYLLYISLVLIRPLAITRQYLILILLLIHFNATHSYLGIPIYYLFLGLITTSVNATSKYDVYFKNTAPLRQKVI